MMKVKVCGMVHGDNIRSVEQSGADIMGFIFYPRSPRFMKYPPTYMPRIQKRAGVFVDADIDRILYLRRAYGLDYIQLHGHESPEYCERLKAAGLKIIRALGISSPEDLSATELYPMADLFLFDTSTPLYGGSGRTFDWELLGAYRGPQPFLLSGGITPASASALRAFSHPLCIGVDINSGFETAPGVKNVDAVAAFIREMNK